MAVAFRAGSKGTAANAAVLTIAHTVVAGTDRALYVLATCGNATDYLDTATVTYNGLPLTMLGSPLAVASQSARVFRLLNPPVGTANVVITTSSATAFVQAFVASLDGVNQTTPEGTIVPFANQYATSPRSSACAVASGGLALDILGVRTASYALTKDATQTATDAPIAAAIHSTASSYKADATAMSWTFSATSNAVHIVVPVNPSSGGGGAATATTLSGPTSGTAGSASSNFTAGANGTITGTVTITPGDGGAGGTFTPTSVAISSGTPTATFTYTAASAGAKTIGISDDGGLTDATSITYTATAAAAGPTINTQPANQSATEPAAATFTVAATTSGGALSYQWQRNSTTNISGATSASYTTGATSVTGGAHNNGDTYRCLVTDSNGTTTSAAATLTVNAATLYGFDFHTAAGMVFGDLAGALTGLARQSAVAIVARAYSVSTGALVATSGTLTTDSAGRLPRWTNASVANATQHVITFTRQSDGEVCAARMTAT